MIVAGMAAALAGAAIPALPPRTVLVLVAPWCAPCRREIAILDRLAMAARPQAVRVVAAEDTRRARDMLAQVPADARWTPPAATRRALLLRTPGLPYAVATDATGAVCAEQRGGLDERRIVALLRRCAVQAP